MKLTINEDLYNSFISHLDDMSIPSQLLHEEGFNACNISLSLDIRVCDSVLHSISTDQLKGTDENHPAG